MDYFIGNCSAPLHIAAAVGCPSMAFYGPTSPKNGRHCTNANIFFISIHVIHVIELVMANHVAVAMIV